MLEAAFTGRQNSFRLYASCVTFIASCFRWPAQLDWQVCFDSFIYKIYTFIATHHINECFTAFTSAALNILLK